jgi:hypothetical protein
VLLGDHTLRKELAPRAGSVRLSCEVGLGVELAQGAALPHARDGDPVCPGSPLQSVTPPPVYTRLYVFIFPLIPFGVVAAGRSCCHTASGDGSGCQLGSFYGLS